jgi:hypothetical protein
MILAALSSKLGTRAVTAIMTHDGLRSKVNAAAQSAANAPTAGTAAAIATALIRRLVDALDAAAAEVTR